MEHRWIFPLIIILFILLIVYLVNKKPDDVEEEEEPTPEGENIYTGPFKIVMSYDGPMYIKPVDIINEGFVSFMECSTGIKCINYQYQTKEPLTTESLLRTLRKAPIVPFDATRRHAVERLLLSLKLLADELVQTVITEGKSEFISNVMQMLTDVNPTVQLFVQIGEDGQIMLELGKLTMMYAYEKAPGLLITPDILSEELYNTRVPLLWTGRDQNCPAIIAMSLALAIFKVNEWPLTETDLFDWEDVQEQGLQDWDPQRQIMTTRTANTKSLEVVEEGFIQGAIAPLLQRMVMYSLRKHFDIFMIRVGRVDPPEIYEWVARIMKSAEPTERQEILDNPEFSNSLLANYF